MSSLLSMTKTIVSRKIWSSEVYCSPTGAIILSLFIITTTFSLSIDDFQHSLSLCITVHSGLYTCTQRTLLPEASGRAWLGSRQRTRGSCRPHPGSSACGGSPPRQSLQNGAKYGKMLKIGTKCTKYCQISQNIENLGKTN
jgi:hypothetical protein